MKSSDLRKSYLEFFESKGHLIHPSDSLVPDDPSLLYTAAGMVQFKPYFVGERVPPNTRITTSQKCMRTDDIDEVGDYVHHTFFEMLGNFSFGDYFKREAITWAWEFLTEVIKLDKSLLWTSVYLDDDEAADVWINEIGFPAERVVRLGEDKNYWPANAPSKGPNGPCGPCNEIFLDVRPQDGPPADPAWSIAHDGNRFVEIWNLVFTQFDRQEDGTMAPLPAKNIDTGMGLERTIAVINGLTSDYDTDLFVPIIKSIESQSGAKYIDGDEKARSFRVIADHIRSAVLAIADGVMPSNIGRGYVLRRLIRNAVVAGRTLGLDKNFMVGIIPAVNEVLGSVYHDIVERKVYIEKVIASEEDKFRRTLDSGLQRLYDYISEAKKSGEKTIDGQSVFTLYDTFGFPVEITREIAAQEELEIDMSGFESAMDEQRTRAKESSEFASNLFGGGSSEILDLEKTIEPTVFSGYDNLETESQVQAIIKNGELVSSATENDEVDIVIGSTPFYAETGGQLGDTGVIKSANALVEVSDTHRVSHFFFHKGRVTRGTISVEDDVLAGVNGERRQAIARAHTATHLLHAALGEVLGEHALQKGSEVGPDRLRFDFSHFSATTSEELRNIESRVNEMVLADAPADVIETSIEDAREMGAKALFGEKYGDTVRVVKIRDMSTELCGGTHLCHTSQVGLFKLTGESSVGAGLRRIEALTGKLAYGHMAGMEDSLIEISHKLGTTVSEAPGGVDRILTQLKENQKALEAIKSKDAANKADDLSESSEEISGVQVVMEKIETNDVPTLQKLADSVADKLPLGVVILAGVSGDKVVFVCKLTKTAVEKGLHAGNIVREVARVAGGGGGGKPEFAQAGGKDVSKIADAFTKAREVIESQASGS